jgi:hypothetical protein
MTKERTLTDPSIVDDHVLRILNDTENALRPADLIGALRQVEGLKLDEVMFRDSIWQLVSRNQIELTSDLKIKLHYQPSKESE